MSIYDDFVARYLDVRPQRIDPKLGLNNILTEDQRVIEQKILQRRFVEQSRFHWKPSPPPKVAIDNLNYIESIQLDLLRKEGHPDPEGFLNHALVVETEKLYGLQPQQLAAAVAYATTMDGEPLPMHGAGAGRVGPPPKRGTPEFSAFPLVQYNTLVYVACNVTPVGNWSIVLSDLLGNIFGDLTTRSIPSLIVDHPRVSVSQIDDNNLSLIVSRLVDMRDSLRAREEIANETGVGSALARALKWLWQNSDKIIAIWEAVERARERARQEQKAKEEAEARARAEEEARAREAAAAAEQAQRDADAKLERMARGEGIERMSGAENHVDRFDHNREKIERTC